MLVEVSNLYPCYQGCTTFINVIMSVKKPLSILSGVYNNDYWYWYISSGCTTFINISMGIQTVWKLLGCTTTFIHDSSVGKHLTMLSGVVQPLLMFSGVCTTFINVYQYAWTLLQILSGMINHFGESQQDDKSLLPILLGVSSDFHQYYQGCTLSTTNTIDKSYYPSLWHWDK